MDVTSRIFKGKGARTGMLLSACFLLAPLLGCIFTSTVGPAQSCFETRPIAAATRWSASQWNATWSGQYADYGYAVATNDGDVYLGGKTYTGAVRGYDALLVKYGQDGVEAWNRTWGGTGDEVVKDIAIASSEVCIVGETNSFSGGYSAFVACFTAGGVLLWSYVLSENETSLSCVATDGDAFYAAGSMVEDVSFQACPYLVKYSLNGTRVWESIDKSNLPDFSWIIDISINDTKIFATGNAQISTQTENLKIWTADCSTGVLVSEYVMTGTYTGTSLGKRISVMGDKIYIFGLNGSNYLFQFTPTFTFVGKHRVGDCTDMQATDDGIFIVENRAAPAAINVTCFGLDLATFSSKIWSTTPGTVGNAIAVGEEGVYVVGTDATSGYDALIFKYSAIGGPADIMYTHGTPNHQINWTVGAGSTGPSQYSVTRDGIEIRNGILWPGATISVDAAGLAVGTHTYVLSASVNGTIITDHVLVRVMNGNPAISAVSSISYQHGTAGHVISFTIMDSSTGSTWYDVLCDGATIHSGTWLNGTTITLPIDGLAVGTHVINVTARDGLTGTANRSTTVTVTAAAPPTPAGTDPAIVGLYVLVSAALGVVVLQLLIPMLAKKKGRSP